MRKVGIIGAGRFGMALAQTLAETGMEVLLVERNGTLVQQASDMVASAVQGDATNARALAEAGIGECDVAVVAVGSNIEVSTLATLNCKELGVKEIVAKATSELHGKILEKVGADRVVYPERDSAHRLGRSIAAHGAFDLMELSEGFSVAEVDVPADYAGKTLAEVDLRKKTGVTVLCIRRVAEDPKKPRAIVTPSPTDALRADDRLIVFGTTKHINALNA